MAFMIMVTRTVIIPIYILIHVVVHMIILMLVHVTIHAAVHISVHILIHVAVHMSVHVLKTGGTTIVHTSLRTTYRRHPISVRTMPLTPPTQALSEFTQDAKVPQIFCGEFRLALTC